MATEDKNNCPPANRSQTADVFIPFLCFRTSVEWNIGSIELFWSRGQTSMTKLKSFANVTIFQFCTVMYYDIGIFCPHLICPQPSAVNHTECQTCRVMRFIFVVLLVPPILHIPFFRHEHQFTHLWKFHLFAKARIDVPWRILYVIQNFYHWSSLGYLPRKYEVQVSLGPVWCVRFKSTVKLRTQCSRVW